MYKDLLFGDEARSKIIKGMNIAADAVKITLGPRGRNCIFEDTSYPTITKDGVTVAQQIFLKDKFENMGVMITRESAENTNREAGDGTTTTVVLLQQMVNEANKYIAAGMNPILIKRGMDQAHDLIQDQLKFQVKEIKSEEEKLNIATISANNDVELGKLIAKVIKEVGIDGVVTVSNSNSLKTEVEYVKGTKIDRGYNSHIFINDAKRLSCILENPVVILCFDRISVQSQIIPLIQKIITSGDRQMILIAAEIEGEALAFLAKNHVMGKFTCVPVKMSSFGDYQKDLIYDLAALTEAQVLGVEGFIKIENAEVSHLGRCESIIISREDTIISGAKGDISQKIEEVKALLKDEKDTFRIEKLKERLGKLTGSIANIKVGSASDTEQPEIRYRIEDALNATKYAIKEGIVEGAGLALLRCYNSMKSIDSKNEEFKAGYEIVRKSLLAPLRTIVNNSGENGDAIVGQVLATKKGYNALTNEYEDLIKSGVIDPYRVVKQEIQNAVSTASILITSGVAIARAQEEVKNVK